MSTTVSRSAGTYPAAPIVVTGAGSGIGSALVDLLEADGVEVIALDVRFPDPAPTRAVVVDLADPVSVRRVVDELPDRLGGLANVAGVPGTLPGEAVLRINYFGLRQLTSLLVPRLVEGSAVANVASLAGARCVLTAEQRDELHGAADGAALQRLIEEFGLVDGPPAYNTSKRLVQEWTPRAAADLIGRQVRVLTVNPGPVRTPILADFTTTMGAAKMAAAEAAVGRHADAVDIAAPLAFALSSAARWVNGIEIAVDGGISATRAAAGASAPAWETTGVPA